MHAQADPPPSQVLWPDPDRGPWLLVLHWTRVDGRIECTGLELRSARQGHEPRGSLLLTHDVEPTRLTTTVLRALPFAATVQDTKRAMGHFTEWWASQAKGRRRLRPDPNLAPPPAELVRRAEEWRESAHGRGGAPPQYGPEHFARVAQVYTDAISAGRSDPRQAVKEWAATAKKNASSSAVAKWIARARKMGLLAPTTRGRP